MSEISHSSPDQDGPNALRRLEGMEHADLINTHARYNLSTSAQAQDITQLVDADAVKRFLLTPASETSRETELQLKDTGISVLEVLGVIGSYVVYKVPVGAKPLAQKRLSPDRESTETYVSDKELALRLGRLWRTIYEHTGHLPSEDPLKSTGIVAYKDEQPQLFPIPPYNWHYLGESKEAKEHFLNTIQEEFLQPGSAVGDYEDLLAAADKGWKEI